MQTREHLVIRYEEKYVRANVNKFLSKTKTFLRKSYLAVGDSTLISRVRGLLSNVQIGAALNRYEVRRIDAR